MIARRAALLVAIALVGCGYGRDPGSIACTPGEAIDIGCASACGLGSCSGDAVLRVCDAAEADVRACAEADAVLRENDDACGSVCPMVRVACPDSGRVTVIHRAFAEGATTCDWDVRSATGPVEEDPVPQADAGVDAAAP
ncbi:hypothetical protein [Sandaracinus amylolyticus]|uniref:Lipoprotein n=1 Tax=Sandaracinus amylolyticus TaxID=927083 RepID=A0A0F6SGZ0_9BACT|nr:hypothetical protein [Sandaracinus amylolyticus]AKF09529.1 hypothetical protein DB32_006678 [Sandaracinus amylolyticus]